MKNSIVTILSLRQAEKQVGCIQHQSAAGNKALIVAFVVHENYLGRLPRSKDIVSAMGKSGVMVTTYLNQLDNDGTLIPVAGEDARATYWRLAGHRHA